MTPTNHDDSVDLMRDQRYQNNRSNLSKSPDTAQARNQSFQTPTKANIEVVNHSFSTGKKPDSGLKHYNYIQAMASKLYLSNSVKKTQQEP